ncbi:MAG: VanZ family protein, partial [Planctomycetota bacterium]
VHADNYEPKTEAPNNQFSLLDLFFMVNGSGIAIAGWSSQNPFLFVPGIAILGFMVACWMVVENSRTLQRMSRKNKQPAESSSNDNESKKMNQNKSGLRWLVYLVLWLAFIFATSCTVVRPQELYSIVRYLTGASPESLEQFRLFWIASWFTIVKGWHFTEFAIVTLLANQVVAWIRRSDDLRNIVVSMAIATIYAISDEYHQSFVPNRFGSLEDVVIDCLGICAAGLFLLIMQIRRNGKQPA